MHRSASSLGRIALVTCTSQWDVSLHHHDADLDSNPAYQLKYDPVKKQREVLVSLKILQGDRGVAKLGVVELLRFATSLIFHRTRRRVDNDSQQAGHLVLWSIFGLMFRLSE